MTASGRELRYRGEWGVEAVFLRNEVLYHSHMFQTRALAVEWAEAERKAIEESDDEWPADL